MQRVQWQSLHITTGRATAHPFRPAPPHPSPRWRCKETGTAPEYVDGASQNTASGRPQRRLSNGVWERTESVMTSSAAERSNVASTADLSTPPGPDHTSTYTPTNLPSPFESKRTVGSILDPPAGLLETFVSYLQDLSWLKSQSTQCLLHAFADTSRRTLAATVYVRVTTSPETSKSSLLTAKTKLTPIKGFIPPEKSTPRSTISRFELQATLLTALLLQSVAASLEVLLGNCYAWSDSQVVLHWLSSD
ncbi:hypothetical protein TSAR_003244 [Trichomalopsis sarcophagae]|uniref:Uncharacterized protein n=1 Tax=Trichomalopsis sarcophagae TaxID=543379 RepID=A0A232EQN2_9HYME|nr:hypothetical protein TSAR_003244 [Trichomalopsis sarcophagae]